MEFYHRPNYYQWKNFVLYSGSQDDRLLNIGKTIIADKIQFEGKVPWATVQRYIYPKLGYRAWIRQSNLAYEVVEEENEKRRKKRKR